MYINLGRRGRASPDGAPSAGACYPEVGLQKFHGEDFSFVCGVCALVERDAIAAPLIGL